MQEASGSLRWVLFVLVIASGAALLAATGAEGALDAVQLWNEDFSEEAKVVRDGAVVGITATDMTTTGGTRNATVSDPTNPGDSINVTLYDDGTHGDATANDGIYTGSFTVGNDGGTSGSNTSQDQGLIDIAEGDAVSVYVDLDGDGSYSQVTMSTDYTGPGMATPFEGGYVSGDLIITITIIIEGEAELDPGSVVYSVDSGPSVAFVMIAPDTYQATIDSTLLTDGLHTVTTLSADEAGNVGTETFEIIVDNTVPDIEYVCTTIAPNGDVLIDTQVSDLHLDTDTVRWNWDDGEWVYPMVPGNDILFIVTIPYDDIVPGEHGTTVIAEDLAGNSMTLITRWILPEQDFKYLVVDPIVIDPSQFMGCETVAIPLDLVNEGEVPLDLEVDLVVDELMMETMQLRVLANTPDTVWINWTDFIPGILYDVDIVITHLNDTPGGDPELRIDVVDPFGNNLLIPPEPFKILMVPTIDPSQAKAGNDITVTPVIANWENYTKKAFVHLVVDGVVVDNVTVDIPPMSNHSVELWWNNPEQGDHEVEVRVYQPGYYGTEEPVDTSVVRIDGGGPIYIDWPDSFKILQTPPIDDSKIKSGENVKVDTVIGNFEERPRNAVVQLVVDGFVVDTVNTEIPPLTNKTVQLDWNMVPEGNHVVEIRVLDPEYSTTTPVHSSSVQSTSGGPIHIEQSDTVKEDDTGPIQGPLGILNPLYDWFPFYHVPGEWQPWFLPLVLVGVILGIGIIGFGRRKKKPEEPDMPDTELKAVEMPPVTGDGPPKTSEPAVPVSLTSTDTGDTEGTVVRPPDKPPASTPPPVVPPIASTTSDDDKGEPCVDIIKSHTRARKDVSDAQASASDAKKEESDAKDKAQSADRTARDAEREAREAQKECDDAKREYEGHGAEEAEKEAKEAEDRLKGMEDRLKDLEGDKPEIDGVSWEPKPGYTHGGVGFGSMLSVSHVYYRDDQAEIDLNRELKRRYKEYKDTKKDLDRARDKAKVERREADEAAERAKRSKERMDEACRKAKEAKEKADRLRGAANDAQENATAMGAEVQAANEAVDAEQAEVDEDQKQVEDCQDCLDEVRRTKARIEELKERYQNLKGGSALKGPKGRHSRLDGQGAWDDYWDSFKRLRDNAKALAEIKGFTEADLPDEFKGLWDWGGGRDETVDYWVAASGTYAGMRAEDYVKNPIPTDTIKAVGGLYIYFQARLDPEMSDGRTTLWEHLEPKDALEAELSFKRFSRTMRNGIRGFEKLYKLAELDAEIGEALEKWKDCLDDLPEAPETPEVDRDKLCYKQCLDKLKELKEAERKMRDLVRRAKDCEPGGLDNKLQEANKLKGQLDRMGDFMDRTSKGLEDYRKAMKASSSCYISTAAYGSHLVPELDTLRGFRDRVLLPRPAGRMLVDHYYRTAPAIAERLEASERDRDAVRGTVGLAARLVDAREGRGKVAGALLSMVTVGVYVVGSLQAWLLTRRP